MNERSEQQWKGDKHPGAQLKLDLDLVTPEGSKAELNWLHTEVACPPKDATNDVTTTPNCQPRDSY